ncbi:helix-turn-helix domain-containing protein [Gorillibacterium sp. CAU 1737]|uniref:ArsR/SmtB family transcription factor n=1 Tax=Gorillibacterium sp. CAU 1737 TaxID=3140362 RepID=UPI00326138EE
MVLLQSHSPIPEQLVVDLPEQALALLNPFRADLLARLEKPSSATEIARSLGESPQRINYHIKALEKVGLVHRAGSRQVKNLVEGLYQAAARTFIIADRLAPVVGTRRSLPEQGALAALVRTADRIRSDALALLEQSDEGTEIPSATLTSMLYLPDEAKRQAFLRDYQEALEKLARKYGAPAGKNGGEVDGRYTLSVAVYPERLTKTTQEGEG